ncbi:MAG TPA: hypothetical protein VIP46_20445, partial [Pyrinomonadaceae bacterium]
RHAPARPPEDAAHRPDAQASPEEATPLRQSQASDESRADARPATHTARQPATREVETREVDLDGDGAISDFEAGYSAALRYGSREAERRGSAPGLSHASGARPAIDEESLRRRAIELRTKARQGRPADDTP